MMRNIHFFHLPFLIGIIAGSYYLTPYFLLCAFILPLTDIYMSAKKISIFSLLTIITLNISFYALDIVFERFSSLSIYEIVSVNCTFNILFIISSLIILNFKFRQEDDFSDEMIQKFQKEKEDFIKSHSEINHRLKDYKLDFSQKLSIIRKLVELGNNGSSDSQDGVVSVLKNVLDLENFVFFKFSEQKNSFVKLFDNNVDISILKKSSFLKWIIERANNFPASINILTKDVLEKNPEFTTILKTDKNIPDIFIPVKSGVTLKGFILAYEVDKKQDNDFRAMAQLVAEILVLLISRKSL